MPSTAAAFSQWQSVSYLSMHLPISAAHSATESFTAAAAAFAGRHCRRTT